jgi:hypothetical protein
MMPGLTNNRYNKQVVVLVVVVKHSFPGSHHLGVLQDLKRVLVPAS